MKQEQDSKPNPDLDSKDQTTNMNADTLKKAAVIGSIAFAAFLLGLVPMWLSSRANEKEAAETVRVLKASTLQNSLATAAIYARRSDFEPARQEASDFFTELRTEIEKDENAFEATKSEALKAILAQRDETITLLARNEAGGADKLSDLYFELMALNDPAQQEK